MSEDRQRLDKWLWFARIAKSRTLAQKLIVDGRVRINRERRDTASDLVKPGDTLTVTLDRTIRVLRVVGCGERRGPATEARLLYEDLTPPEVPTPTAPRDGGAGRPTKRDRRAITALKRGDMEDER
ncbi:MAG: RNA-binding S4 domain-containing protein [Bauldia sp.]